jgi:hypothetical protein
VDRSSKKKFTLGKAPGPFVAVAANGQKRENCKEKKKEERRREEDEEDEEDAAGNLMEEAEEEEISTRIK